MAKNSRTKNSIINILTSTSGQLLNIILKFVVRTFFIHTLGKQYLGINGLFSDILTMLSLTELGFDTAINFKLYKPLADGDEKRLRVLMKFYRQVYRIIGTVILILGLGMIPLLPKLIKDYDSLETLGINAVIIFLLHILRTVSSYLFFAYKSAIIKADQKQYILDIVDYFVEIANSIVQILVLVFTQNFVLYTATVIFFNILRNLIDALIAQKRYPEIFRKEEDSISKEEIVGLLKDCGALFVYKLNGVVLKATDNTVLSIFIGLSMVGMYSNYLLFFNTIRSLLLKVYTAVKASAGNLFAVAEMKTKYQFFQVMNYLTIVLYGTAAIGVAVCSNELIDVWVGADYVIPQPFSTLIGIELLCYGLMNNLAQIRNISGAFQQMWYRPALGAVVNIVTSVILVQVCGIHGVILGTIIAAISTYFVVDPRVIYKFSFKSYRPVSEYYKRNLQYIIVLVLGGALDMWLCSIFFVGHGWFSVIVHALIVSLTIPAVFAGLYRKSYEYNYIKRIVMRVLGKARAKLAK